MATPISNVTELQAINGYADGSSYYLTNDIDASDTINWNAGAGFNPLRGAAFPYAQAIDFDGKGYKIKDLYINRPGYRVGLFYDPHGVIQNITLENVNIHGDDYSGGLAARLSAGHSILSCNVYGQVTTDGDYCGGICGHNNGTISKCSSETNITHLGVLAGGSLVGFNLSTITDCYATGNITAIPPYTSMGGLVGRNDGTINRCYSAGQVRPVDEWYMGGFVGTNNSGTILSSYWDTETSGYTRGTQPDTDPPSGKTTAQMKQEATFAGWDFKRTWKIVEGKSYPTLRIGATKKRAVKSS